MKSCDKNKELDQLSRQLKPDDKAAAQIAADVCEGLSYAHERGVVHCDLKPANILFSASDRAKVADFGIAAQFAQLHRQPHSPAPAIGRFHREQTLYDSSKHIKPFYYRCEPFLAVYLCYDYNAEKSNN